MSVYKQICSYQKTRFKAYIVVGDGDEIVGLGVKYIMEFVIAICDIIILECE